MGLHLCILACQIAARPQLLPRSAKSGTCLLLQIITLCRVPMLASTDLGMPNVMARNLNLSWPLSCQLGQLHAYWASGAPQQAH
eukprot:351085-Chlamydomonas_euryale.AAC.6